MSAGGLRSIHRLQASASNLAEVAIKHDENTDFGIFDTCVRAGQTSRQINQRQSRGVDMDPPLPRPSPCAPRKKHTDTPARAVQEELDQSARGVLIGGKWVHMYRAKTQRASRAARPSEPSDDTKIACAARVRDRIAQFEAKGLRLLETDTCSRSGKWTVAVTKGPGVRSLSPQDQSRLNHLATLKSKSVESRQEASHILNGAGCPEMYDRLLETALKANAVNNSLIDRRKTQGAAFQTPRVNCRGVGQAAAAQCEAVLLSIALAKRMLSLEGIQVVNPMATTSVQPGELLVSNRTEGFYGERMCVASTTMLLYNSVPVKLTDVSIRSCAQHLARCEIEECAISEVMGTRNQMLLCVCNSVLGDFKIDAIWAAMVLVVYVSCDARGRPLLDAAGLTDLDLQMAWTLEAYGRAEITRRARLKESKKKAARGQDGGDLATAPGTQESVIVCKKRKLQSGSASTANCCSYSMLKWWWASLQSEFAVVLQTMVAQTKSAARAAAQASLASQSVGTKAASNPVMREISANNALRSVEALAPFVSRRKSDIPAIVALDTGERAGNELAIGVLLTRNQASSTILHACREAPPRLRAAREVGIMVLHCEASQALHPCSDESRVVPGVIERHAYVASLASGGITPSVRVAESAKTYIREESGQPLAWSFYGVARSFLGIVAVFSVSSSVVGSARILASEARRVIQACGDSRHVLRPTKARYPQMLRVSRDAASERKEPRCTPASPMAVGFRLNELLRRWMLGRSRKSDPCRVLASEALSGEMREGNPIADSEPLPLATIVDATLTADLTQHGCCGGSLEGSFSGEARFGMSLHIGVHNAVRLPEILSNIESHWHRRALLYVGCNHASLIGDTGSAISAGACNASINNSKKISCADVTTLPLLSAWDVYGGGLVNLKRCFVGTAYAGVYTSPVDTGITPPGLMGHFLRSDKRHHGCMALGQEAVNDLALGVACASVIEVGDGRHYVRAPIQLRGIPHGFTPGVHHFLDHYFCALDSMADVLSERDGGSHNPRDAKEGLFCLPFSPFTQALRPASEPLIDTTARQNFRKDSGYDQTTGHSYIPDCTDEKRALVREPLFRRPCQVSVADNPFCSSYSEADTFFNAANAMALCADGLHTRCKGSDACATPCPAQSALDNMWSLIDEFHFGPTDAEWGEGAFVTATDACVLLFGPMYPSAWAVGEPIVAECYALAAARQATACFSGECKTGPGNHLQNLGLDSVHVSEARSRWSAFRRFAVGHPVEQCAWKSGVEPLMKHILLNRGSHDLDSAKLDAFRAAFEGAVRGAWLVHSPDGKSPPSSPCPASECASPAHVRRPHIDPVFAANPDCSVMPRGCLVGCKPYQYRQLLNLLAGAFLPLCLRVQVYRNEGGLSLRVSSAADIHTKSKAHRSDKSISPVQTEADDAAYGTRDAKLVGCCLQRDAWNNNAKLLGPLVTCLNPPPGEESLTRGEYGDSSTWRRESSETTASHRLRSPAEEFGVAAMRDAACRPIFRSMGR